MLCRPLAVEDSKTKKVQFIGFDITGGDIEYDILASQGPNTTLRKVSPIPVIVRHVRSVHVPPCCRLLGGQRKSTHARRSYCALVGLPSHQAESNFCDTASQTYDTVIDDRCPQKKPFEVVRCIAHQHVGSEVSGHLVVRCLRVVIADVSLSVFPLVCNRAV